MLSIANNLMSTSAARYLGRSYDNLRTSVCRLSSGLRINGARDDAAGLAVRELIRADVARLEQGSRNAQDAISMLQTAEGAMGVMNDILVRMEGLAEQAATDSYSADQRSIMNEEFQQLIEEIDRIANDTKFNGISMLNNTTNRQIQVGSADTTKSISLEGGDMTCSGLGLAGKKGQILSNKLFAAADAQAADVTTPGAIALWWRAFSDFAVVNFGVGTYTVQEVVDTINARSRAVMGYDAAEIRTDDASGAVFIAIQDRDTGAGWVAYSHSPGIVDAENTLDVDANWTTSEGNAVPRAQIDTTANAELALTAVSAAIVEKDKYRAKLGYWMNRLESAAEVAVVAVENLSAAESRISDVDVAREMAVMTRNQVLAQAGISMLAQANQMPQMALKLLG